MKRLMANALLIVTVLLVTLNVNYFAAAQASAKRDLNAQIPLNPKIKTGKLDNGLTYYIMENKKPENRVEIQILVRAGSVQEEDYQAGLAHFLEHMCFNGTKNFPKDSLVKFLESTGVRFGADLNASTSFDRTYYTLTIPLDKPGMLDKGMQVLEDWAMWVTFDSLEIEKERGVILEEKRLRSGAQTRLMEKHLPVILKGSKLADRLPIGLEEVIKNAPRKAFTDYYDDWYRPDLFCVIVVGDIKEADAMALIQKHFENFKFRGEGTPKPMGEYPIPDNKDPLVSIAYDKEMPMGNAVLYIKHKGRDEKTYGSFRASLKEQLFGMMLTMRLQELTKEAQPPFLYAAGGASNFLGGIRIFNFIVVPNAGDFAKGLEKGLAELFRVDQNGFTPTELERAKETILAQYERSYNERDKTESASYARELSGYFQEQESAPGIEVEFELVKEFLAEIQIAELNKMVAELITNENVVFTVSLPEGGADKPTEAEILEIYKRAENTKYDAYVDDLGDAQLMKKLPKKGKITSTKKLPNFDITEMKLSNGARVLLKPTDFKNDQILFQCWADGGASLYPNDYFLASDAASIIDECGLGEFTSTKLSKLLQSKMVGISPSVSDFQQGMRGSSTPKDKEIFFQLLNMQFTQPRKDKDAFTSYITKNLEMLKNRDRDPQNAFRDTISAVLGSYHPNSMPLTPEKLKTFDLDKAFKIYQERFADAENFTFLFVGAFKIEEFRPLIEQYIASLPATKKKEKWKDMGIKSPTGQIEKVVKRGIEPKATVRLVINKIDDINFSSEEILRMNMMREITNIRLREEIREEKGGVYGIGIATSMGIVPSLNQRTQVYFGCDPTRVDELITEVKRVFDEMQVKVGAEYLQNVKEIMKKEFETRSKENNYWLGTIQNYDYTKRDIAFLNDYDKKIDGITDADIIAAAKKYLDYKKNFIRIVQMPEDDDE